MNHVVTELPGRINRDGINETVFRRKTQFDHIS